MHDTIMATIRNEVVITPPENPDDVDTIRLLFREYEKAIGIDLCFQDFESELAALPGRYAPPNGRLYIAYCNDKVTGCVGIRKLSDGICEMKRLYVRPQYRGRKIGRLLAQKTVDVAKSIGYETMRLDTLKTMKEAVALYESLGFERVDPYYDNPHPDAVYMELRLVSEAD
jgi:ribosomal protein S18 acetylase RimI-like enzyme